MRHCPVDVIVGSPVPATLPNFQRRGCLNLVGVVTNDKVSREVIILLKPVFDIVGVLMTHGFIHLFHDVV
jgi:hypothetical protein